MNRRRPARRSSMRTRLVAVVAGVVLAATACGGDDTGGGASDRPDVTTARTTADDTATDDTATDDTAMADTVTDDGGEGPASTYDLAPVCEAGEGIDGMAAYDAAAPGPHPIVLLEADEDGDYTPAIRGLPDWAVVETEPFDDNREIIAAELVGCMGVTAKTARGIDCEFEDTDATLALFDATYDITVRVAATGEIIGSTTVEGTSDDCPFVAYIEDGDTEYVNTPLDDDIVAALGPIIGA